MAGYRKLSPAISAWAMSASRAIAATMRFKTVQGADSGGSRPRIRDDVAQHSDLISLGVPR
jgi:hypothetical protein